MSDPANQSNRSQGVSDAETAALAAPRRRTLLSAHGEPMVWLTGAAMVVCLALIIWLVGLVVWNGATTFWPSPIQQVTLGSGETFLGIQRSETAEPAGEAASGGDDQAPGMRRRYQVGNLDLGQESFRWERVADIESVEFPADASLVERQRWGVFFGVLESVAIDTIQPADDAAPADGDGSVEVTPYGTDEEGNPQVRRREFIGNGDAAAREAFDQFLLDACDRRARIDELNLRVIPRLQQRLTQIEWDRRAAQLERQRTIEGGAAPWPIAVWLGAIAAAVGCWVFGRVLNTRAMRVRTGEGRRRSQAAAVVVRVAAILALCVVVLERPWGGATMSEERLQSTLERMDDRAELLAQEQADATERLDQLRRDDARYRVVFVDPNTGRFAPESRSELGEPMLVSTVVREVRANDLSFGQKLGVYFERWGEFLGAGPRETPTEGGVLPVIVGTVVLTLLLTVAVVPLGVIAAIYMREYAPQGVVTSTLRIAINNLAGVPSIVYGMFGLGFFCYTLGAYLDSGPTPEVQMSRGTWWPLLFTLGGIVAGGLVLGLLARRDPGRAYTWQRQAARVMCGVLWIAAISGALYLVSTTPYFNGAFAAKLPEAPTFGGRGILWASLTLALLTLPVVIVATEEAIAAVPNSMREGSVGCGGSKWQTIRRIVLPASMPGILTGAILAMARGAGEVAPIMLVGAVNLAPSLPVSGEFPYLHGDRSFMHLGFHIYNLGFQSPDSEASRPMVWTTTLLLILIVLALNLGAIIIRGRVRGKHGGAAV